MKDLHCSNFQKIPPKNITSLSEKKESNHYPLTKERDNNTALLLNCTNIRNKLTANILRNAVYSRPKTRNSANWMV